VAVAVAVGSKLPGPAFFGIEAKRSEDVDGAGVFELGDIFSFRVRAGGDSVRHGHFPSERKTKTKTHTAPDWDGCASTARPLDCPPRRR
jgi:hypothetical protein